MATKKDISYGVIPFFKDEDELKVFLIHQYGSAGDVFWTFPKGHPENSENPEAAARREFFEESGMQLAELLSEPIFSQSYWFMYKGDRIEKTVEFFIGFTKDKNFTIQEEELESAGWFTLDAAMEQLTHDAAKEMLTKAVDYVTNQEKMKKFKCYDCDQEFQAESREEILGLLYDHYMKDHKEIITGASETEKKDWMEKFEKDWEQTS